MSERIDLILALAVAICETFVNSMVKLSIAIDVTISITNVVFVQIS